LKSSFKFCDEPSPAQLSAAGLEVEAARKVPENYGLSLGLKASVTDGLWISQSRETAELCTYFQAEPEA
jgi:hypothetical protein